MKMKYYQSNRKKLLKKAHDNNIIGVIKRKLVIITRETGRSLLKKKEISTEACKKKMNIKQQNTDKILNSTNLLSSDNFVFV